MESARGMAEEAHNFPFLMRMPASILDTHPLHDMCSVRVPGGSKCSSAGCCHSISGKACWGRADGAVLRRCQPSEDLQDPGNTVWVH